MQKTSKKDLVVVGYVYIIQVFITKRKHFNNDLIITKYIYSTHIWIF